MTSLVISNAIALVHRVQSLPGTIGFPARSCGASGPTGHRAILPSKPGYPDWVSHKSTHFAVAETVRRMVVDHADGLHERVADGGSNEPEAPPAKGFAQGLGERRCGWHFLHGLPSILDGGTAHESPDVGIKAPKFLLQAQEGAGVPDSRRHLLAVADDAGVAQEFGDLVIAVCGNDDGIKPIEGLAV